MGSIPGSASSTGEGRWQPTLVFFPKKSHGWKSLAGYSPKGHKELDTPEWLNKIATMVVVMKRYLLVILICIFLMTNNVEHLFLSFQSFVYLYWSRQIIYPGFCWAVFLLWNSICSLQSLILSTYQLHDLQIFQIGTVS